MTCLSCIARGLQGSRFNSQEENQQRYQHAPASCSVHIEDSEHRYTERVLFIHYPNGGLQAISISLMVCWNKQRVDAFEMHELASVPIISGTTIYAGTWSWGSPRLLVIAQTEPHLGKRIQAKAHSNQG